MLCPIVTYVALGTWGAAKRRDASTWPVVRAMLTFVSLAVNVVTI